MDFVIRPASRDEIPIVERALSTAFAGDPHPGDREHFEPMLELERTRCAFVDGEMVGTLGTLSLELAIPGSGATLPTAGTTMITVKPTHRRRGLLRALMRAHFDEVRDRGEPLAALWASESSIYSRFGYGPAADRWSLELERAHGAFARPLEASGRCRMLEADEAAKLLPELWEEVWRERPGSFARSSPWWQHRRLPDPAWQRGGATSFRYIVYEQAGFPRGYLQYRQRSGRAGVGVASNELWVWELVGLDAEARAALWRQALDVDLIHKIRIWSQPTDCELVWLLEDPRRLEVSASDALWVRLLDVESALAARSYAVSGNVRLGIVDPFEPENDGTYELEAGPDGAHCRRSSGEPELELDVCDLGAVYLGGRRLGGLARAGRVRGDPAVIRRADTLFAWDPAPWCPEVF